MLRSYVHQYQGNSTPNFWSTLHKSVLVPCRDKSVGRLQSGVERIESFYLGEYRKCAELAIESGQDCIGITGSSGFAMDVCVIALSSLIMLRKTKNSKYKTELKRTRKLISWWVKQGNMNLHHWEALLEAETFAGGFIPEDQVGIQ